MVPDFSAPHVFGTRGFPKSGSSVIDGRPVMTATQVHRADVIVLEPSLPDGAFRQAETAAIEADGLATDRDGCWVGVYTADCAPILLYDPDHGAVAAVHAGWRGALMGVAPAAIRRMVDRFGSRASRLEAAIGPHIGVCCFEVGRAVLDLLAEEYDGWERWVTGRVGDKGRFDLREFLRWQLQSAGLEAEHLYGVDLCTKCEATLLSSYRREGRRPQGMISAVRVPRG